MFYCIGKRFMSFKCVPIYGLMFRILTRFHALYFGASCIHRNSIVWRRVNLARFPYWPEKRKRRISRYSYFMKTLISSEYGLTISGHVTVLRQWLSEKNTGYIIKCDIDLLYENVALGFAALYICMPRDRIINWRVCALLLKLWQKSPN